MTKSGHSTTVKAKELGIDISGHRSKSVDEFAGQSFDQVITLCDNARDYLQTACRDHGQGQHGRKAGPPREMR